MKMSKLLARKVISLKRRLGNNLNTLSENPSGRMTRKSFHKFVSSAIPEANAENMEEHIFRIFDTNNDGVIDFVEFLAAYYVMSGGTPEENLALIFRAFDVNGDGVISKQELKKLVHDMVRLINVDIEVKDMSSEISEAAFLEMD